MVMFTQQQTMTQPIVRSNSSLRGVRVRLFLTCWLAYALHFSPYVYRELYLTMSLAEKHTVHVDEYVDLHPDLFVLPGRGSFVGTNPGTSILAAVPYWLALPLVNRVAPVRPPKPGEHVSSAYKEQRYDRVLFYQKVRERGLDVRLGLAATITSVFFMALLSALSVVVMFYLFGEFGFSQKASLWLSLLYAFGTPIFFRTATLSLNLLVALLGLFSFAVLWRSTKAGAQSRAQHYFFAGFLAGWAVLTDYSGVIPVSLLGLFALSLEIPREPFWPAVRRSLWYIAGALGPIGFLLFYQWYCYGNLWLPVQYHQPARYFVGYTSYRGFGRPQPAALWGLFFDPLYGLLVFAPIFTLALYHIALVRRRRNLVPTRVAVFSWSFFLALWVFCSCIDYTVRHQWQDGVRYIVPAVPFLFFLVADALIEMPRALAYFAALAAVVETWCLAMVRENPLESIARILLRGFELPWLTTLIKTAHQYFPFLETGASPIPLFLVWGLLIWGIWKLPDPGRPVKSLWEHPNGNKVSGR